MSRICRKQRESAWVVPYIRLFIIALRNRCVSRSAGLLGGRLGWRTRPFRPADSLDLLFVPMMCASWHHTYIYTCHSRYRLFPPLVFLRANCTLHNIALRDLSCLKTSSKSAEKPNCVIIFPSLLLPQFIPQISQLTKIIAVNFGQSLRARLYNSFMTSLPECPLVFCEDFIGLYLLFLSPSVLYTTNSHLHYAIVMSHISEWTFRHMYAVTYIFVLTRGCVCSWI